MKTIKFHRRGMVVTSTLLIAVLSLLLSQPLEAQTATRGIGLESKQKPEPTRTPKAAGYYALVIGNNDYQHMPKLKTAESDAHAIATILKDQFGFQTTLLLNATRQQIVSALNTYRKELDDKSSLLIYYAGHGYNDSEVDKAYWLPIDAQLDDNSNWISADDITTNTRGIHASHILIVSDSCYSGTIVRDAAPTLSAPKERDKYLAKMAEGRSRTLMASGGNEPVADGGGGGHSIFANALLRGISSMDKNEFTAGEVFNEYVVESVAGRASQTPEYSPLRNSGHESGDFIFIRKHTLSQQTKSSEATKINVPAQRDSSAATTRGKHPQGKTSDADSLPANLTAKQYAEIASQAIDARQWVKAEKALRAALLQVPNNAFYHSQLGFYALRRQQKYAEAEAECREAVRLKPMNAVFHTSLATLLGAEKKLAEAEVERREAVRLQPTDAFYHAYLASNLNKQGKWAEAEIEARKAIQLSADNAAFHNTLGVALRGQNKLAEAEVEFREAVRINPGSTEFAINLQQIISAQKKK